MLTFSSTYGAQESFFDKGKKFFDKSEYNKSRIFFERDIVFNPRSEKSYLYLAKIYKNDDNDFAQETNLNNVLLLNPKNDEAIYLMILLKIKQSDYNNAKELIDRFTTVCEKFCEKKNEISEKFEKLTP